MAKWSWIRWRERVVRLAIIGIIAYVSFAAVIASLQRFFIYHPTRASAEALDRAAQSVRFERWRSPSGAVMGWKRLVRSNPSQGQVLIAHGNAGCAIDRSDYATSLQAVAPLDVFVLEYPGYGDRPGSSSETSLYAAAEDAFRRLNPDRPIYLLGESLGTGVAAYLAGLHPQQVAGVLLIAPYTSLVAVGQRQMPWLPVNWLMRDRFPAADHLDHYRGPVAVFLAGRDQIIPTEIGRALYEGYTGPKRLWEFPRAEHNSVMLQPPQVWSQVIEFWETRAGRGKTQPAP